MGMGDIEIVQVLAMDKKTKKYTIEAFGLDVLVDTTIKKMPDFIKGGFIAAQKVSKAQKRVQCEEIIYYYVRVAKEGFWDKVPIVNIFSANNKILDMFKKIGDMLIGKTYSPFYGQTAVLSYHRIGSQLRLLTRKQLYHLDAQGFGASVKKR